MTILYINSSILSTVLFIFSESAVKFVENSVCYKQKHLNLLHKCSHFAQTLLNLLIKFKILNIFKMCLKNFRHLL